MTPRYVQIARWAKTVLGGVTASRIARHFQLSDRYVQNLILQIMHDPNIHAVRSHNLLKVLHITEVERPKRGQPKVGLRRPVVAIPTGSLVTISPEVLHFESIQEAEKRGGFIRGCIQHCLRGAHKTHCGYIFMYAEDYAALIDKEKETQHV